MMNVSAGFILMLTITLNGIDGSSVLTRDYIGIRRDVDGGRGGDLKKIELPSKCIESLKLSCIKLNKIFKMLILQFNIKLMSELLSLDLKKACVNFNKNIYLLKLHFGFTTIFS